MDRFMLVDILCALTACRPTMSEGLRMLEGGVDVPDRPQPFVQRIALTTY
jgi:hypothetical protein